MNIPQLQLPSVDHAAAYASFFGLSGAELGSMQEKDLALLIERRISDCALDQVAGLGVPLDKLPAPTQSGVGGESFAEKIETLNAITDPAERAAFYAREVAPCFPANQ